MHFIMSCAGLTQNLNDMNQLIDAITEIGSMTTVLIKLTLYRVKRQSLAYLLNEVATDYDVNNYRNEMEIHAFVEYVVKAKTFFKLSIPTSILSAVMYFARPFTVGGIGVPIKIGLD